MQEKYRKPQISTAGLVAHYKLWAGLTGEATVFDYALNGLVGTPTGTDIAPAYPGFRFNGTDDYITIADDPILNITTTLSVCAWAKNDNALLSDFNLIVSKFSTTTDEREWFLSVDSDEKMRVILSDNGDNSASVSKAINVHDPTGWHFYVFTFDASGGAASAILYLDGTVNPSTEIGSAITDIFAGASPISIGSFYTNHNTPATDGYWDGAIDNVMIFDRALSPAAIKSIYELTKWRYPNN